MKTLAGKTALITGAATGIGREMALALAREHVDLFLVDFDQQHLAEVADLARDLHEPVVAHVADLTRAEDLQGIVDRLLQRWNGVDILINNAGIGCYGSTHRMSAEQWDRVMEVNLLAPIRITHLLLPAMLQRSEAHVVNVCSVAGLVAAPKMAAYHASKFGLLGFTESLRAEYGPRGLGVTALCPGFVRTNILQAPLTPPGTKVPKLPRWITTSPQNIAERTVRAIRRNEGVVVVTPLAHFVWRFKRYAPGLLDWLHHFRLRPRSGDTILPQRRRARLAPPAVLVESLAADKSVPHVESDQDESPHLLRFPIERREQRRAA